MFGKKKKRLEISAPSNFEHRVHTGFDPREQKFTGLPQQWQSLLADTANRPKPMVDPSYITPIQLAPMKVECDWTDGIKTGDKWLSFSCLIDSPRLFSPLLLHPHHCSEATPLLLFVVTLYGSVDIFLFSVPVLYVPTSSSTCYTSCCFFFF